MYKGVVVFMLHGLKQSEPIVITTCPETEISGRWFAEKLSECVANLCKSSFEVSGIVSDNHAANVSSFNTRFTKVSKLTPKKVAYHHHLLFNAHAL